MEPSSSPSPTPSVPPSTPKVRVQSLSSGSGGEGEGLLAGSTPAAARVELPKVVQVEQAPAPFLAATPQRELPKSNFLVTYWRKVGGGSLTLSLGIHALILVGAYFMVQTIAMEPQVDFLPGGGSKAGQEASQALSSQMQQKKRSALTKSMPVQRIVSHSATAAISLPDTPMDDLAMPDTSSLMGGSVGGGGFSGMGVGTGSGSGIGSGAMKGFTAMTFFGRQGEGDGLPGSFYDMKQDRDRKPLSYTGAFNQYAANINKAASKRFSESALKEYYKASQQVNFTYLLVPANLPAAEGPKCFNAEKEVEPRGWFVHYSGMVTPPKSGTWRFVGFFDDLLVVYVNNKPVLDGSWVPMVEAGERDRDEEIRQEFKGPSISGNRTAYSGKWIKLNEPFKLDIVVGETPGGLVGGLLMVQNKDEKYEMRPDGTPVLPLFTTTRLEMADLARLKDDAFARRIQVAPNPPLFEVKRSALSDGRPGGLGLLPVR